MKSLSIIVSCLLLTATVAFAVDSPVVMNAVKKADDFRVSATISADPTQLDTIFSDDLRYAHSSGVIDNKASYIKSLVSTKHPSITYEERNFTAAGAGIVLMTGKGHFLSVNKGEITDLHLSFLGVWREEKGTWRFLAWQSCRLPEAK